ncbi:acetyltransferase [Sphingobacterium sp. IITKGP-BTPF85]|uniref:acetyltransferase n=1 Tax=Sphingobacterium sp. IITKGP-BTPF85 TaxID=1338009 RepID=UPI00038A50FE|nr:acetyltransferase [Sphingobacterium sp. IITKGP-BTPF85]KKX51731.1 N-acetylneuraminate synthase [Sphingobacterium sp. IITKGP-BTPF85]
MEKIAIIGYSGHSYVVLDASLKSNLHIQFYSDLSEKQNNPFNLQYIGDESKDAFNWDIADSYILGIGDNTIRELIVRNILNKKKKILNIIHPNSTIANFAKIGIGNFIGPQATINALATIGCYCIINSGSIVEHECQISDFVHLGPGSVLAGQVIVGRKTFIGANTVVKQGISIGENVVVGAGSVVLKDIPNGEVWVGNPAKKLR